MTRKSSLGTYFFLDWIFLNMQVDKMENAPSETISSIALACRLKMTFYAAAIFSEGPFMKDVGIFWVIFDTPFPMLEFQPWFA